MLEVLKHFFDVPGIVFILGIDRAQLISAATAVFGLGLDGDGYLRRFIDLDCSLPSPDVHDFCMGLANADGSLVAWRQREYHSLLGPIGRLCRGAGFSLRKTHQFMVRATIAAIAGSAVAQVPHTTFLVFLREYDPNLYDDFLEEKLTSWEILIRLRTLDPQFGVPGYSGGTPFIDLLAGMGQEQKPKPFLELLKEDYDQNNIGANLDYLSRISSGNWKAPLKRLRECIDFCVAFET